MTILQAANGIYSDDFNEETATINPIWTFTDRQATGPAATCVVDGFGGADPGALFTLPAGYDRDMYENTAAGTINFSTSLLQTVTWAGGGDGNNTPFQLVCKINEVPSVNGQSCGFAFYSATVGQWIRSDLYYDGALKSFNAHCDSETFTPQQWGNVTLTNPPTAGNPIWLRFTRDYAVVAYHSLDWSDNGDDVTPTWNSIIVDGTYAMNITQVGIFAGTVSAAHAPKFDYFFETSAPISPEDEVGGTPARRVMVIS